MNKGGLQGLLFPPVKWTWEVPPLKKHYEALEQLVNTEGFISTSHGLQQTLKQDQLQFSMPRDFHVFSKTKEVLSKRCT